MAAASARRRELLARLYLGVLVCVAGLSGGVFAVRVGGALPGAGWWFVPPGLALLGAAGLAVRRCKSPARAPVQPFDLRILALSRLRRGHRFGGPRR